MTSSPAHKVMSSWQKVPAGFVRYCVCGYSTSPHADGIQARLAVERHVIDAVCPPR